MATTSKVQTRFADWLIAAERAALIEASRSCSTKTITRISTRRTTICSPPLADMQVGGSSTIGEKGRSSAPDTRACRQIGGSIPRANEHSLNWFDRSPSVDEMESTEQPIVFGA